MWFMSSYQFPPIYHQQAEQSVQVPSVSEHQRHHLCRSHYGSSSLGRCLSMAPPL